MINNTIVILSERMAGWLMFNRFHKIGEKMDLKNPNRNIYIFKDSTELREAMVKYKQFKDFINSNITKSIEECKTCVFNEEKNCVECSKILNCLKYLNSENHHNCWHCRFIRFIKNNKCDCNS